MLSAFITHIIWQLLAMGGWLEEHCVCLQLLVSDVFISSQSVWGWLSDPSPIWWWCVLMPNVTTTLQLLSLDISFKGVTQIVLKDLDFKYIFKEYQHSDSREMAYGRCGYHMSKLLEHVWLNSFWSIFSVKSKDVWRWRMSLSSRQHH